MKLLSSKLFLLLCFIFSYETKAKDITRFSVGGGIFNYMENGTPPHNDQSQMLNLEVHSGKKMFNLIKPFAGFLYTTENTYYAYGGFQVLDIMERKRIGF